MEFSSHLTSVLSFGFSSFLSFPKVLCVVSKRSGLSSNTLFLQNIKHSVAFVPQWNEKLMHTKIYILGAAMCLCLLKVSALLVCLPTLSDFLTLSSLGLFYIMLCLIYVTAVVSNFIDITLHNAYYFSFLLIISFNLIIHFTLNNTTHYVKALESGKEKPPFNRQKPRAEPGSEWGEGKDGKSTDQERQDKRHNIQEIPSLIITND